MAGTWIFQCNPKMFDIDSALQHINLFWWRLPQYKNVVRPGDTALMWRSGKDAGIVALGHVIDGPEVRGDHPDELQFELTGGGETTLRVLLDLRSCRFVSKAELRDLPLISQHRIVRAPMGTVFKLDANEWAEIRPLLMTEDPSAKAATEQR